MPDHRMTEKPKQSEIESPAAPMPGSFESYSLDRGGGILGVGTFGDLGPVLRLVPERSVQT